MAAFDGNLNYRFGNVPKELKALYWNEFQWRLAMAFPFMFLVFGSMWYWEDGERSLAILNAAVSAFVLWAMRAWRERRKATLEEEVVRNLPKGIYLVYRYSAPERFYVPELVNRAEFKRALMEVEDEERVAEYLALPPNKLLEIYSKRERMAVFLRRRPKIKPRPRTKVLTL